MSQSAKPAHRDVIALLRLPGVGSATVERVMDSGLTAEQLAQGVARMPSGLSVRREAAESLGNPGLLKKALAQAEQDEARAQSEGVKLVTLWDEGYPWLLRLIPRRPVLIYLRGSLPPGRFRAVASVGTRAPNNQARDIAYSFANFLAAHGFAIVSGLALGIDTASHRGTLEAAGSAIAILGGGLGHIYPKQNQALADEILAAGGALISEQAFDQATTPQSLVRRDRLQSGMSLATIVVQSAPRGGSMHTASAAKAQKRKLYCGPADVEPGEFKAGAVRLLNEMSAEELPARQRLNQIVADLEEEAARWEAAADTLQAGPPDTGSPEGNGQLPLPFSDP